MEGDPRPSHLRTILLAIPRRITKKFKPPVYVPGTIETGVRPGAVKGEPKENWRIDQLSQPSSRNKRDKYVFVPEEGVGSGVKPGTLAGQGTSRSYDLSRPTIRYLTINRNAFSFLGNPFVKNMNNSIKQSWNSIYNYYKKALADLKKKRKLKRLASKKSSLEASKAKGKGKGKDAFKGKGPGGKPKTEKELLEEKEKKFAEWCASRSQPKKIPPPDPLPPRKVADLNAIAERMNQIAEPRMVTRKYLRPSIDSAYMDPLQVTESAKTYVISERVIELAKCPPHRLIKERPIKPGAVKRGALTCIVSPRFAELAVPKKKAAEKDNDLKENPFMISPYAKKYVATPRILELAKPTER